MRILVLTFLLIGAIYCQKGEKGPKGEKGSKPEKGTWTPPPDWTPPSKGSKGTKGTTTGGQGSTTEESTTSAIIVNSTDLGSLIGNIQCGNLRNFLSILILLEINFG